MKAANTIQAKITVGPKNKESNPNSLEHDTKCEHGCKAQNIDHIHSNDCFEEMVEVTDRGHKLDAI